VSSIGPWVAGQLSATPQENAQASLVRPLVKADGWIDWGMNAEAIERQVRAMQPWPRAFTTLPDSTTFQVLATNLVFDTCLAAGEVAIRGREVLVGAKDGVVRLVTVQLPGRNESPAEPLVQGRRLKSGDRLGKTPAPDTPGPLIRAVS
jgi:methionyl-tRNA formyltransferase